MIRILIFITIIFFVRNKNLRKLENSQVLNKDNWEYSSLDGVFYQVNLIYCKNPASINYNILGIYVPKKYFLCSKLSSGKYSCSINLSGKIGIYTASTAPIVMPINTYNDYSQEGPTDYYYYTDKMKECLSAGFIYIYAGCRGVAQYDSNKFGAPWGVTDLKAAIRYIRYNSNVIPGDMNSVFSFGHSSGGALSCLLGITGDSNLFTDYLNDVGAAMEYDNGTYISDVIKGSQC